jgi:uncharacterized protein YlxW (UPF0749 family)
VTQATDRDARDGGAPGEVPGDVPGGPPPRRSWHRRPAVRRTLAVAGVALAAGLLFGTSATVLHRGEDRQAEDLHDLVAAESARLEQVTTDVDELRLEVADLVERASGVPPTPPSENLGEAMGAGRVAVEGPGVVVRMWDAPAANAPADARPDDLLVHQQDVESVVNALWAGGAEAMTIQGQRVTSDTAVRCVGNVLLLRGVTYSPPYEIAAIGSPEDLMASLHRAPGVDIYLQYVDAVGLGWSATEEAKIQMPATEGPSTLNYVKVLGAAPTDAATTQPAEPPGEAP